MTRVKAVTFAAGGDRPSGPHFSFVDNVLIPVPELIGLEPLPGLVRTIQREVVLVHISTR